MSKKGSYTMMTLSPKIRNLMRIGLTLTLGLSLFAASTASATRCDEYEVAYAETPYDYKAHKHLDVVCKRDWRPISCEPKIGGKDDSYNHGRNFLSQEVVALNEAHQVKFSDHHGHEHKGYYGCHFRANNFLTIFTGHESLWKLGGNATCVPKRCVDVYKTDWYEWDSRDVDLF